MNPEQAKKAQGAIAALQSMGVDCTALVADVQERCARWQDAPPDDLAVRYVMPATAPRVEDHFTADGPQFLAASALWSGFHYRLTPGQREWLRENTEMIPAETATVGWVQEWHGTRHPRSFQLSNDVHQPNVRNKVFTTIIVRDAGKFFAECAQKDAEKEKVVTAREEAKTASALAKKPKSYDDLLENLANFI